MTDLNTQPIEVSLFHENKDFKSAGKWANFIGIVFIIFALTSLCIFIFLFTNLNELSEQFMRMNGMSNQALEFINGAGKWIFTSFMVLIIMVFLINAYNLIQFHRKVHCFSLFVEKMICKRVFNI